MIAINLYLIAIVLYLRNFLSKMQVSQLY